MKSSSRSELPKFVSDHLLVHVDRNELATVVDGEGESDEFRRDVAIASPGLDDLLLLPFDHFHDLLEKFGVDVGAFFERASHGCG